MNADIFSALRALYFLFPFFSVTVLSVTSKSLVCNTINVRLGIHDQQGGHKLRFLVK